MKRYDVYGFRGMGLDEARAFVEDALGIAMSQRDSEWWGGIYYRSELETGGSYQLYRQVDGGWKSNVYPGFRVILLVNDTSAMDEICDRLTKGRADPFRIQSNEHPDRSDDEEAPEDEDA